MVGIALVIKMDKVTNLRLRPNRIKLNFLDEEKVECCITNKIIPTR